MKKYLFDYDSMKTEPMDTKALYTELQPLIAAMLIKHTPNEIITSPEGASLLSRMEFVEHPNNVFPVENENGDLLHLVISADDDSECQIFVSNDCDPELVKFYTYDKSIDDLVQSAQLKIKMGELVYFSDRIPRLADFIDKCNEIGLEENRAIELLSILSVNREKYKDDENLKELLYDKLDTDEYLQMVNFLNF